MLFSWFQEGCQFLQLGNKIHLSLREEAEGGSTAGRPQMPGPPVEESRALRGFWEKHEEVGMAKRQYILTRGQRTQ